MKRVSLFLVVVFFATIFAGCNEEEEEKEVDKTGFIKIVNNSSVKADGAIVEYESEDAVEVFIGLSPGSEQLFELKAGIQYIVVAMEEDTVPSRWLDCSPETPRVIEGQTQIVTITDPSESSE